MTIHPPGGRVQQMNFDNRVQSLADRIGCPVIVFDAKFNVAAFSVHDGEIDATRLSMILSRKGSERATELIKTHGVERLAGAVTIPAVDGSPQRIVAALRYQGHVTGYVSYVVGAASDEFDHNAADIQLMRDELGANLAARAAEERESADLAFRLLSRLFGSNPLERRTAADELVKSDLISSSNVYAAMVFRVGDQDNQSPAMSRLVIERALARISAMTSRNSVGTVIDGEGVLVIPHEVNPQRLQDLISSLTFPDARGAGGSVRTRLSDVYESRREARIALRATCYSPARYPSTACWENLGVDRLLLQLPLEGLTLQDLPPGVQRLLTTTNSADLASTLESYLDNGADAQRTAKALFIHRSTLYYRLDRIRAIVDADLSSGEVRLELHTALRVASYAGLR